MNFTEIRQKYPEYSDMSDEDFANKFHQKFYSDMDFSTFASKVGYTTKSLVDQIPGLAPAIVPKEDTRGLLEKIKDYTVGGVEAGAHALSGVGAGLIGAPVGALQGLIDPLLGNKVQEQSLGKHVEQKMLDTMASGTYEPRTETGKQLVENVVSPLFQNMMAIAPMTQFQAMGSIPRAPKKVLEPFAIEEPSTNFRNTATQTIKDVVPEQMDLDLGQPNKFGQRPSEYILDENGIPIKQDASIEAQTTARQGDLFSQDNIKQQGISENLVNWEQPDVRGVQPDRAYLKQQEIEQAYLQKAQQDAKILEDSLNTPTQSSTNLGLGKGMGKYQGGGLNTSVFLEGLDKMNEALSKATDKLAPILGSRYPKALKNPDGTTQILLHNTDASYDPRAINPQGDLGVHLGTSATSAAVRGDAALSRIIPNKQEAYFAERSRQLLQDRGQLVQDTRTLPFILDSDRIAKITVDAGNWETPRKVAHVLEENGLLTKEESGKLTTLSIGEIRSYLLNKGIDAIEYTNKHEKLDQASGEPTSLVVLNTEKLLPLSDALGDGKKPPNYAAMAKGQRGAIRPQEIIEGLENLYNKIKPESLEDFIVAARQAGLNAADDTTKIMFDGLQKEQQTTQKIEQSNKALNTIKKIAGKDAEKVVEFNKYNPDEILTDLQNGPDSSKPLNFYEKHGMSQGYMPVEASNNPPLQQAIRYLKSTYDRNAVSAENILYSDGTRPGTAQGIIYALNKAEKLFDLKDVIDLNKQWFKAKDNPNYQFTLNIAQQRINQIKEQLFSKLLENTNKYLSPEKQLEALPNYIPSVHTGKFWGQARAVLPDGSYSKPLIFASENSYKASLIARKLKSQGYEVSGVKSRGNISNDFGTVGSARAANFQYMLDIMQEGSPEVKQLYNAIANEMQARATTTKGQHQHQKDYRGFKGEVGNRPWLSDKQNYYDMKDMLVDFVESHYDWLSAQEASQFTKKVLDPASKIPENNRQIISDYTNNNIIGKRFNSGIDVVINDLAESLTGASPKQQHQVASLVGSFYTQMLTAMGSPIHAMQNVIQPYTVLIPQMLREGGTFHPVDIATGLSKSAAEYMYVFGGKQLGEIGKLFGADAVKILGSKNFMEKQAYAEAAGITNPTLVESGSVFKNKYVNRAHQFTTQGLLSKPSEQAARWTVFSTMADFLQKRGYTKQEAFNRAREITENYMVDYGYDAKAGIWKSLGVLGDVMGRLQSFATNQFSQIYVYGKRAPRSFNDAAAFAGYMGTIYLIAGMSGMPGFDILEELMNRGMSNDGKTFSLRNYLRQSVGDDYYGGMWEKAGLGAAPSFAVKSINTDGDVPLPTMFGVPIAGKMAEQGKTVGRRLFGDVPWEAETEAEKGKELLSFTPTAFRNIVEGKYLSPTVKGKQKIISPNTGEPLHTVKEGEFSLGNIRSKERAKQSEISSEQYKENKRFYDQKAQLEKDIKQLGVDMFAYGNTSPMKEKRYTTMFTKYVKNYTGNPEELNKDIQEMVNSNIYMDNKDIAEIVRLSNQPNPNLDTIRKILFHKKYAELRK